MKPAWLIVFENYRFNNEIKMFVTGVLQNSPVVGNPDMWS